MTNIESLLEKQIDITKELIKKKFTNFLILIFKNENDWQVFPAIQLELFSNIIIKIEHFNPKENILQNIPKKKLKILNLLLSAKNRNLSAHIDLLLDNQSTKIIAKNSFFQKEIKFVNIKNLTIQFVPFDYKNSELIFKPLTAITPIIGNEITLDSSIELFITDNLYIFNHQLGFIYHLSLNKDIHTKFNNLLFSSNLLTQKDIEAIKNIKSENIKIIHPEKSFQISTIEPQTILEINELSQGITVKLLFKYNEKTFLYNKEENIITLNETPDSVEILPLKTSFHNEIYSYIKDVIGKWLIREKPIPRGSDYTFSAACSLENFLINAGEKILIKGIELRKTGQKLKIKKAMGLSFKINYKLDWFEVKTGVIDENDNFNPIILNPNTLKKMLIQSKENFYLIKKEEIENLKQLFHFGLTEKATLKLSKYNLFLLNTIFPNIQNNKNAELTSLYNISKNLLNFEKIESISPPKKFCGNLRSYQQAGFSWLYFLNKYKLNGCLADDMGLGKTIQTLALLQKLKEENALSRVLIVAPVSILGNWEYEIQRFTPDLKFIRYHGANRMKLINEIEQFDIILISYQTLRNDLDIFLKLQIAYLILDEAQAIKSPVSQITKAIKLLTPQFKLSLSGTPIENNTLELWSQFDFLLPGLLGTEKEFCSHFAKPIEEQGSKTETNLLKKIIFPFILRRKKEDVAKDLPEKEEIILYVEMEEQQRKIYNEIKNSIKQKLFQKIDDLGINKSALDIFTALLRLRQITLFPSMIDDNYENIPSCKFELIKTLIDELINENHKVLIFSQFLKSLKILKTYFDGLKLKYSYLDGSTKEREKEINQFQEDEKIKLFLISLKAGAKGINLTEADYVIIFDPWWNPAIEQQAIDRAHRIGQKKKVIAYRLITKDSVEEKIIELQNKKLKLIKDIITEEKTFFKSLTKEDILNLFS